MKNERLKIWELALLCSLCVSLLAGTWAQSRQERISSSLVRLHVLAVSDDAHEQEIKLHVRDAVIAYLEPRLDGVDDAAQARVRLGDELAGIRSAALAAAEGREVSVTLDREYYPTREYAGFTLPAGKYDSLRVVLGAGEGHNWWCVVFPPLCLSAAEQTQALDAMEQEDYKLVTESDGYRIKFRIVELWGEFLMRIKD